MKRPYLSARVIPEFLSFDLAAAGRIHTACIHQPIRNTPLYSHDVPWFHKTPAFKQGEIHPGLETCFEWGKLARKLAALDLQQGAGQPNRSRRFNAGIFGDAVDIVARTSLDKPPDAAHKVLLSQLRLINQNKINFQQQALLGSLANIEENGNFLAYLRNPGSYFTASQCTYRAEVLS